MTGNYSDIISIEAELAGYRQGCLKVSIDLQKQIVIWRDSHQWNNNFLRSISPDKVRFIREFLPKTRILQWEKQYGDVVSCEVAGAPSQASWVVILFMYKNAPQQPVKITGQGRFPQEWIQFRDLIEAVTKVPFRLR